MMIVETGQIPKLDDIVDVPLDDLIKVYKVCQEMQEVCDKERGIGISAVQVGIPWKLFLVRGDGKCPLVPKDKYGYFINCDYSPLTENEEQVVSVEGCLSIRSPEGQLRLFEVKRFCKVHLFGYMLEEKNGLKIVEIDDALSLIQQGVVFQHEIDHQKSILISDFGKEVFVW